MNSDDVVCAWMMQVLSGLLISNVAFVAAALAIYALTLAALDDATTASNAARMWCLSPANIFFSTVYTESLFAALCFAGMGCWIAGEVLYLYTTVYIYTVQYLRHPYHRRRHHQLCLAVYSPAAQRNTDVEHSETTHPCFEGTQGGCRVAATATRSTALHRVGCCAVKWSVYSCVAAMVRRHCRPQSAVLHICSCFRH